MQCLLYLHESVQITASGKDLSRAKATSVMATEYVDDNKELRAAALLAGALAEHARKERRAFALLLRRAAENLRVTESHHQLVCDLAENHWREGEIKAYRKLLETWRKRLSSPADTDFAAAVDTLLKRGLKAAVDTLLKRGIEPAQAAPETATPPSPETAPTAPGI